MDDRSQIFPAKEFPELCGFLKGCFHQDWDHDYGSDADNVIDAYIVDCGPSSHSLILSELNILIARYEDTDLPEGLLDLLGCEYPPEIDGWTQVGWLKHVRDKIQASVKG